MAIKRESVKKKMHKGDLLINAANFLKLKGAFKSNADMGAQMKESKGGVSRALQPGKDDVSERFVLKFEKTFLFPRGYKLEDFEDMDAFLARMRSKAPEESFESAIASLLTRQQGEQKTMLDILTNIDKKLTTLIKRLDLIEKAK